MSKNFELMQQDGCDMVLPSIRPRHPLLSEVSENVRATEERLELGQLAREEILRLVQRVFFQNAPATPRAVLFAGVERRAGCSQICLMVLQALRSIVRGSVCLVDANFRSPSLACLLGATNRVGLADALSHEGPIHSFVSRLSTENAWLMSSGSACADLPNLLHGDRIKTRFDELRKEFDYLLVDAPAISRFADATALSPLTDGLVLVLEANSTRKEPALKIMDSLRAAQIRVLGAVLNKRTFPIPEVLYAKL